MLKSLLDRTDKPENGPAQQGSLLDMLDTPHRERETVAAFPAGSPKGRGSLLNRIGEAEDAAARHRRVEESARLAEMAELAARARTPVHDPVPAAPDYRSLPQGGQPAAARVSKQEQLDLLADQLNSLATKSRRKGAATSAGMAASAAAEGSTALPPFPEGGLMEHFSFVSIVREILHRWMLVILFAILGAAIAAVYALSLPNTYQSVAEILVEPRGIKVVDNAVTPNGYSGESIIAFAESQVRILTSSSVIDPVVTDLELALDPEFNGENGVTGLIGSVFDLLFRTEPSESNRTAAAREYLYKNLDVVRINQTFTIRIGVTTRDPAKSARIANAIAREYMQNEAGARSSAARNASDDLSGRLDELRAQVREAEERVETYKAENGLVDADGKLVSEVQLARLNDQLALAQAQTGEARSRAELAANADLSDVISGSLPTALATPTISQLRVQYSRAKSSLEKTATRLGPRHPERIGAESELRSAREAISAELSRIVRGAQSDYESARGRQADIQSQVNVLKASAVTDSAAKVRLRELEREVAANRQVYEAFLLRSRETGEQENIRSTSARIISEAVPPNRKAGPNRRLIAAAGGFAGAMVGVVFALLPLVFGGLRILSNGASAGHRGPALQPVANDLYSSYEPPAQRVVIDEDAAVTRSVSAQESPPMAPPEPTSEPEPVTNSSPRVVPEPAIQRPIEPHNHVTPEPPRPQPAMAAETPQPQPTTESEPPAPHSPSADQMPQGAYYPPYPPQPYGAPPMPYPMGYGHPVYPAYQSGASYAHPQHGPTGWAGYPPPPPPPPPHGR